MKTGESHHKGGIPLVNLTAKELTALEDQIGMEKTLVKKYQAMSSMCNDAKISQCLSDFAQKHQQHCTTLMTFLQ
jgi:rubrerythrin